MDEAWKGFDIDPDHFTVEGLPDTYPEDLMGQVLSKKDARDGGS